MLEYSQSKEVYELLSANYVEDHDAAFRFQYSAEFLNWYDSHGLRIHSSQLIRVKGNDASGLLP